MEKDGRTKPAAAKAISAAPAGSAAAMSSTVVQAPASVPAAPVGAARGDGGIGDAAGSGTSDELLVQRLRDGDAAAGDVLVRRYCEPLMRYLQRLTRSEQLAEELHQQTWLSVLDHLDRFDARSGSSGGGFKAWLFRIATNKANDHWRSRTRERAATEGLSLVTDDVTPPAEQRLGATEQDERLSRAIAQLPENQRQVLMLRYYSNLKFVEIAKMLGCPLNTALGRMHKAVTKLRQMME